MPHWDAVIALAALSLSIWREERRSRDSNATAAAQLQEIKTKVDMIYQWFQSHVIQKSTVAGD